jgi:hypothetical protein
MKALERFLAALCIISLCFQFAGLTGSAFLIIISLLSLSTYYFVFGFAVFNSITFKGLFASESYKEINALRIVGSVVSGMSIATIITGIIFRLFSWAGANEQIAAGVVSCLIILVVGTFRYRKSKTKYQFEIFYRVVIFTGIGILFFFY